MAFMFFKSASFNKSLSNFNMSSIIDMNRMFKENTIFNQNLSGWNVKSGASKIEYDLGATSWSAARPNFL